MTLNIKDLGIGQLKDEIKRLGRLRVTLGVQGERARETHPDADVPTGLLAFWLHFGTPDAKFPIPARPYVDRAIAEIRDRAGVIARRGISDLIDRRADNAVEALTPIAVMGRDAVVRAIDESKEWADPLAASTVRAKGHDTPLLDTGTIRESVSGAVRDGDQIIAIEEVER